MNYKTQLFSENNWVIWDVWPTEYPRVCCYHQLFQTAVSVTAGPRQIPTLDREGEVKSSVIHSPQHANFSLPQLVSNYQTTQKFAKQVRIRQGKSIWLIFYMTE